MQRRVYDAANVLAALGIVQKEKQGMLRWNNIEPSEIFPKVDYIVIWRVHHRLE